jgi:predicted dienelactone hydrolase
VASHLASHGFAVALPDHIGSNGDYRAALFAGLTHDYFAASDFLNRPLDVTFLLDELARTNVSQYAGKLNLEQVAIAGILLAVTLRWRWAEPQSTLPA